MSSSDVFESILMKWELSSNKHDCLTWKIENFRFRKPPSYLRMNSIWIYDFNSKSVNLCCIYRICVGGVHHYHQRVKGVGRNIQSLFSCSPNRQIQRLNLWLSIAWTRLYYRVEMRWDIAPDTAIKLLNWLELDSFYCRRMWVKWIYLHTRVWKDEKSFVSNKSKHESLFDFSSSFNTFAFELIRWFIYYFQANIRW